MRETEIRASIKRLTTQHEQLLSMHRASANIVVQLRADVAGLEKKIRELEAKGLPGGEQVPTDQGVPSPVSPEVPK